MNENSLRVFAASTRHERSLRVLAAVWNRPKRLPLFSSGPLITTTTCQYANDNYRVRSPRSETTDWKLIASDHANVYPTQTPLLFSGSRLDCQWFLRFICAQNKNVRIYARIDIPHPTPFRFSTPRIFFNLSIYCRLYTAVQDPVSFTVTTGLLGRLGLGLRVRVSIPIIFTFFRNLL